MGSNDTTYPADREGPVRPVSVAPFAIDRYALSNQRFALFVAATGYETEAERLGWSFVFEGLLPGNHPPTRAVAAAPWWRVVHGACWRQPEGPRSDIDQRWDHPALHLSWNDAAAYARWCGGRLPTEAEWEYAARGDLEQTDFPWGNRLQEGGRHRCNVWQGTFPHQNRALDGYVGTAPVDAFEPNGFGLYNVVGNVWEWTADLWEPQPPPDTPSLIGAQSQQAEHQGTSTESLNSAARIMKGGSYLCHASYCNRYRLGARTHNTADSSSGHLGVRIAYDSPPNEPSR